MPEALSADEVRSRTAELPGWEVDEAGTALRRTYRLAHLPAAILAVHIAQIQNELNHHSDLLLGYDSLAVTLTTHAAGSRITAADLDLARRISDAAAAHGAA
ncbi:4a-hydroxytetrahydrobiopterin dehydratase [Actinacidiphila yeochonensis]|uniref:4a-hydroxytetrahydrobiopterin dehydratase n=1 Tax=Actinacidiphila yeochonensis TaxID=89050 RepID=UPI000568EAF7|nr:4a-hydroxytetrahydrobiopterin dehydratase [Actinacidiphila yeochonensis]